MKKEKYRDLQQSYSYTYLPTIVSYLGKWHDEGTSLIKKLSRKQALLINGEYTEVVWQNFQRANLFIQRCNARAILARRRVALSEKIKQEEWGPINQLSLDQ